MRIKVSHFIILAIGLAGGWYSNSYLSQESHATSEAPTENTGSTTNNADPIKLNSNGDASHYIIAAKPEFSESDIRIQSDQQKRNQIEEYNRKDASRKANWYALSLDLSPEQKQDFDDYLFLKAMQSTDLLLDAPHKGSHENRAGIKDLIDLALEILDEDQMRKFASLSLHP